MNELEKTYFLTALDSDRWAFLNGGNIARQYSANGSECRILGVKTELLEFDSMILLEIDRAKQGHYNLEWKTYKHDFQNQLLCNRLLVAGFVPQDEEVILVRSLADLKGVQFDLKTLPAETVIAQVLPENSEVGLEWIANISYEVGRMDVVEEQIRLRSILKKTPYEMSIYVILMQTKPVACGRIHYPPDSIFAEFYGGRTKSMFRRNGFFTALVKYRLIEAAMRGRKAALVDALPTSEIILRKLGFEELTRTRPYTFSVP